MMKRLILILLVFFSSLSLEAQYKSTRLKMAEGLLEEGKIYAALEVYLDIVKKDEENKYVVKKIAEINEDIFNFAEAGKWYYELMQIQNGEYPKAEYKYAQLMKMSGNYELAMEHFSSFSKSYKGHDRAVLSKLCKAEIKSCKTALKALPNADYSVTKLSNNINSIYPDLAPFGHNGSLYYSAIPSDTAYTYQEYLDSAPAFQIYVAKQIEDDQFDSSHLFLPSILSEPFKHTSNGAFNKKGDKFFFTRCKENVNGKMICKIYCTIKKDSVWQKPVKLSNEINDANNDFSSTQPTILNYRKGKRDKKDTELLIFASTMPGGLGNYDLWSSEISDDLTCNKPVNLGKNVNSPLNDLTPFFDGKNKFYFSSNGKGGFGGLDVFVAPVKKGKIKRSKNLDLPVNSSMDDWYYNQLSSGTAFIASNRKGSRAYNNDIVLDDIYLIKKETKKYLTLNAVSADSLKKNLKNTVFKLKFTGDNKSEGQELRAGKSVQIIPNRSYDIIAQKNGYINQKTIFSTSYDTKSDTINWTFELTEIDSLKEITLENIYFNTNSFELKPESKSALNRLYQTLIVNPEFIIEIGAHTDDIGSKSDNQTLSENRAKAVADYLLNKDIGANRLIPIGYGSNFPIAELSKEGNNEENRKLNRRITFKIISVMENQSAPTKENKNESK